MPCLVVLMILAAQAGLWQLWVATGVFVVSLGLRSVDMELCDAFPMGTHFMWHSLNGVFLYLLVRAVQLQARQSRG